MTVAFVSASAWFDGATGLTADKVLTLPSHSTGNLILVLASWKDFAITAQISGYTEITEYAFGTTATSNGSGSMKVGAWYKVATSGAESNPTLDFSTATGLVGEACVLVFSQTLGDWVTPAFRTGDWAASISQTVLASASALPDGAAVAAIIGISDDSATFTRPTTGIAGVVTWNGNYVESPATHASTTTGNDMAADAGYRLVTTGSGSMQLTATATLSAAELGSVLWVILADQAANQLVTPTTAALVATKYAPTVTASDNQLVTPTTAALTSALFAPSVTLGQIITVLPRSGAAYAAAVTADSPTAYYRMGEASGSVIDTIGGPSGTTSGTVTRDATGLVTDDDGAIDFDGSTGYIAVTSASGNNPADTFSVEAWIRPDAISGDHSFVYKGTTNRWGFSVRSVSSNKLSFWSNGNLQVSSTTQLVVGSTYHVVFTKSGSTRKIYVNGSDVSDLTPPGTTNFTNLTNTDALNIGRRNNGTEYWNGVVDELAIYAATAISAGTVLAHYTAGTTGGLAFTFYAPTVTATDNQLVTPTTKAAVLATFAPTVTATDVQLVTPTTKALTLATFAPTVTATDSQLVTPTTVALSLQMFAPSVSTTDHQAVTPTTKSLTLATFAPLVSTPQTVTPATKTLALTTFAPTISNPDPQLVTPTTASLITAKFAPSVGVSDAASIVPPNASLGLTTFAPTVTVPNPQLVTPTTPTLELHTFEPTAATTDHQRVTPTTAGLVTARMVPTVTATANQSAIPSTKALTLTTYAPQVTVNNIVATVTIGLTLSTFAPSVTAGTNTYAFPDPASLTLTGYAPFIDLSAFKLVTPATAVLVLTTYPPTAEQHSVTPLPTPIYGFAIVATGPGAGVEGGNGGATVQPSGRGSTTVRTSGPSAKVTIR